MGNSVDPDQMVRIYSVFKKDKSLGSAGQGSNLRLKLTLQDPLKSWACVRHPDKSA